MLVILEAPKVGRLRGGTGLAFFAQAVETLPALRVFKGVWPRILKFGLRPDSRLQQVEIWLQDDFCWVSFFLWFRDQRTVMFQLSGL